MSLLELYISTKSCGFCNIFTPIKKCVAISLLSCKNCKSLGEACTPRGSVCRFLSTRAGILIYWCGPVVEGGSKVAIRCIPNVTRDPTLVGGRTDLRSIRIDTLRINWVNARCICALRNVRNFASGNSSI